MATTDETATYIGDLATSSTVPADSGSTGKRYKGGAEIRKTKDIMKATFPNVTGAVTPTHTELNYVDGVTSAIQTQIDGKSSTAHTHASTDLTDTAALTYNADTDVSANGWVVDEDTMVSNLATKVPTQQSVKAYVDALSIGPTSGTEVTLSAATHDFAIPSGVSRIHVAVGELVLNATDNILIRIGSSSTPATSGYLGGHQGYSSGGFATATTSSISLGVCDTGRKLHGGITLVRLSGTAHRWAWFGSTFRTGAAAGWNISGTLDLAGELDILRLTSTNGVTSFSSGYINVVYD